jgi:two-component sensor histidine kinase
MVAGQYPAGLAEGSVTADIKVPFPQSSGRSAQLLRAFDWTATPLGPIDTWPIALRTMVSSILSSSFPAAIVWGCDLTTIHNDPFLTILGQKPEAMGRSFRDVWAESWEEIGPIARKACRGEPTFIEDFPLNILRSGHPEMAYFTFCYSPLYDDEGKVAGFLDTVVETTERVATERQIRLMNSELQHRMKNMFSTVNSIISQTLRTQRPLEEIRPLLLQRMATLANAHAVVTDGREGHAGIQKVLDGSLRPYCADGNRFRLKGPGVLLSEKQALSLSLTINELATNATKYGALAVDDGFVEIVWQGEPDSRFRLQWTESGGPPVPPPERRGFGRTLMERVAPHDFGGTGTLTYAPDGVIYVLETDRLPR